MTSNSFGARDRLTVGDATYEIVRLNRVAGSARLPFSLKVLLENLLRNEDGRMVTAAQIEALAGWDPAAEPSAEIAVHPGPGADAGLHRGAVHRGPGRDAGGDGRARRRPGPDQPAAPGRADHRPLGDRRLLRPPGRAASATSSWNTGATPSGTSSCAGASRRLPGLRVVPPGTGICHQVNIEHLARVVFAEDGTAFPDTLVGTDSHTPMVNGLGVLGWGVGGIEAEAAMLGQPVSMLIPRVVGVRLSGELPEGSTATDLVLTIAEAAPRDRRGRHVRGVLRAGRGRRAGGQPGHDREHEPRVRLHLRDLPDRRRRPWPTCGSPAAPAARSRWSRPTPRSRGCGTTRATSRPTPQILELDLSQVVPSIAGPKRPQDRIPLAQAPQAFRAALRRLRPRPRPSRSGWTPAARSPSRPPTRSRSPATGTATGRPPSPRPAGVPAAPAQSGPGHAGRTARPPSSTTARW